MSVQLILYPQRLIPGNANEFVVNGINFTNLSSASTYSSSVATTTGTPTALIQNVLTNATPAIPNLWYRFISTASATPAPPTNVLNNAVFNSVGATSGSGIYQQMTNLIPGETYFFSVEFSNTASAGSISCAVYNGTTLLAQGLQATNGIGVAFGNFWTQPAGSTTATIVLTYSSLFSQNFTIQKVGVISLQSVSLITYTDGQVILDLYEDENIPLTLSVDDFKNVAEKVQSYSKAFNLPATKRNNQIFENLFEVTRSAQNSITFNPYAKTKSVLKQDGFILFEGYLRVLDIQDKEGEISYNVNLYSEVISFADTLKDKTFSQLDFYELAHLYNKTNIKNSWNNSVTGITYTNSSTSGFRNAFSTLKYPFVDWNHSYTFDSAGFPVLPNLESSFRPFINIKYLIDRIFQDTEFTYKSDFFSTPDFENLYMDFNWGSDNTPNNNSTSGYGLYKSGDADNFATTSFTNINLTSDTFPSEFGFDTSTNVFTCPAGQTNSTFNLNCNIKVRNVLNNATIQFRWLKNGATVINLSPVYSPAPSATAQVGLTSTGSVTSITVIDGGNYASVPSVDLSPWGMLGAGFSGTAVLTGTAVTSVTIDTVGGSYSAFNRLEFNGVSDSNSTATYSAFISEALFPGDTLELQFKASANNCIKQDNLNTSISVLPQTKCIISGSVSIQGVTTNTILQTLRGEIGQWEFLKGIMTMFNLISSPDKSNPNNIIIEPYKDMFLPSITGTNNFFDDNSTQLDWTDKIDTTEIKLEVLADLNKTTVLKFVEDDDDYAFNLYKNSVQGHLYGSQIFDASTTTGNLQSVLEGEEEIIAEPFAATVPKPLMSQFPDFITPSIYSYNADDGTTEGFENSPRIMYNNGVQTLTSCTYLIPAQNGVAVEPTENKFLQFSHLTSIPTSQGVIDFHFGECQLISPIGSSVTDNLFNTYWLPYFNELYNPDTRTMSLKVNLTPGDLNTFNFYNTVFIKNRLFRVNKIDYKPNELATVEFILIP
jgi:hypothetical protein